MAVGVADCAGEARAAAAAARWPRLRSRRDACLGAQPARPLGLVRHAADASRSTGGSSRRPTPSRLRADPRADAPAPAQPSTPPFWALVARACPDYEASRRWLRAHEAALLDARDGARPGTVSLDRALSKLGMASRSEARALITARAASTVDGRVVRDAGLAVVPERVRIAIDGEARRPPPRLTCCCTSRAAS